MSRFKSNEIIRLPSKHSTFKKGQSFSIMENTPYVAEEFEADPPIAEEN